MAAPRCLRRWATLALEGSLLLALTVPAVAGAQVRTGESNAGAVIRNTAALDRQVEGTPYRTASNTASLTLAERLDVMLAPRSGLRRDPTGMTAALLLTNTGNGREAFTLSTSLPAGAGRVRMWAVDTDGDRRFDAAHDTVIEGETTPVLDPGAAMTLLLVIDPTDKFMENALTVTARALTGGGAPGTAYAGRGEAGGDAVVGATGATATAELPLILAATLVDTPTLIKRQQVSGGGANGTAMRGSVITYTLEARLPEGTPVSALTDPIPAGTRYRANSLTVDAVPVSDAADTDGGRADASGIAVALPAARTAVTHTIRFDVVIL